VDAGIELIDGGRTAASCRCWWGTTPSFDGRRTGFIGGYAAADEGAGVAILNEACAHLAKQGVEVAIVPIDGTTWSRYRLVVDRGAEPPFFMEPDNPDAWPAYWTTAGFESCATYTSALNEDLTVEDRRGDAALARLRKAGITIRELDLGRIEDELRRIHALSLAAFGRNTLYSPISREEFSASYRAVLPCVRPELVLLAEQEDALAGFAFAIPDVEEQRRRGTTGTVILKTVAVDPALHANGLGCVLTDLVHRRARALGYRRAIHALMHDSNASRNISRRTARTIRRYALFARTL
jgi:L-amino acid N-acyltransferase YncA